MSSTATAPPRPILCLVMDHHTSPAQAAAALAGGVDWIQLRDRELEAGALYELAAALRALIGGDARLLVNRRVDVALAAGADGVHLGYDALPVGEVRPLLGEQRAIGVSAHAPDEVETARAAGASYAHLAPIFAPLSKGVERPPLGLEPLGRACGRGLPVLAQGGIDAGNAARVMAAGADGVAVTGAILGAPDPQAAARTLRAALDGAASEAR